jgi:hypothetical protein
VGIPCFHLYHFPIQEHLLIPDVGHKPFDFHIKTINILLGTFNLLPKGIAGHYRLGPGVGPTPTGRCSR